MLVMSVESTLLMFKVNDLKTDQQTTDLKACILTSSLLLMGKLSTLDVAPFLSEGAKTAGFKIS
jgi:uncharacterized ParB-like nuclease family protein